MSINPVNSAPSLPLFTRRGGIQNNLIRKIINSLCICIICFTGFLLMNLPSSSSLTSRIRRGTNSANVTQNNRNYINARQYEFIAYDIFSLLIWVFISLAAVGVLLRLLLIRCGMRLPRNWVDMFLPSRLYQLLTSVAVCILGCFFLLIAGTCLTTFLHEITPTGSPLNHLVCFQILGSLNLVTAVFLGTIIYFINYDHLPINEEPPPQNPVHEPEEVEELV